MWCRSDKPLIRYTSCEKILGGKVHENSHLIQLRNLEVHKIIHMHFGTNMLMHLELTVCVWRGMTFYHSAKPTDQPTFTVQSMIQH